MKRIGNMVIALFPASCGSDQTASISSDTEGEIASSTPTDKVSLPGR